MKTIGFFNVQAGVGTTTLVYHLAWMYQELGVEVVALDLDPQADLTAALLPEERFVFLGSDGHRDTVFGAVESLLGPTSDLREPVLTEIGQHLLLLPGDLSLSLLEEYLSDTWRRCNGMDAGEALEGLKAQTAFYRVAARAAQQRNAQLVLIDIGGGIGAINRAALIACNFVILPIGMDFRSLQSLILTGPTLRQWRSAWEERLRAGALGDLESGSGEMRTIGYVSLQRAVRPDRSADVLLPHAAPMAYHMAVLNEPKDSSIPEPDPHCLAKVKRYPSLLPLAREAHKPMFLLKPADGALGSHAEAVVDCYRDFKQLAIRIANACGIDIPS